MLTLERLITSVVGVLLDFDGPVCSIFAGRPAPKVARRMVDSLTAMGVENLDTVEGEQDPLAVLRWTDVNHPALTKRIEDILCAEEQQAISSALPTPSSRDVISAARKSGRPVVIVSNNSPNAIHAYLDRHQLTSMITTVIGRRYGHPSDMKPNPVTIYEAIREIDVKPNSCVLIGDSPSDIEAAKCAGVLSVGFVKNDSRKLPLRAAGADALIESMGELIPALER